MLACRVCLAVGIDDPEAWLEQVSPRQLAIWKAFYQLEPWGADLHRTANVSTLLSGLLSMFSASHGQTLKMQQIDDFMPSDWADKTSRKKPKPMTRKTAKGSEQLIASMFPTADKRRIK